MSIRKKAKRIALPLTAILLFALITLNGVRTEAANNITVYLSAAGETKVYGVDPSFRIEVVGGWIQKKSVAYGKFSITVAENTGCGSRTGYVYTYKQGQTSPVDVYTVTQWGAGHSYVNVTVKNPTCTSNGQVNTQCSKCGYVSGGNTVPKIGHNMAYQSRVNSTCTLEGYDLYKCKNCSYTEKRNIQKVKAHTWKTVRDVEPTCQKMGHEYNQCTVCGTKTSGSSIPKIGHVTTYKSTVNPTCLADGYDVYKCKYCSYTENKNIKKAKGHTWKTVTDVTPTCTKAGHEYNQCTVCQTKTSGSSIPKIAHVTVYQSRVNPTCTAEGYDIYKCKNCTYTEKKNIQKAKGHTWKTVRDVAPTCTKEGHEYNQCTVCNTKTSGSSISKINHTWKVEKKDPTYTTDGYEKKYCTTCKKEEYNNKISRLDTTLTFISEGKTIATKKVKYGDKYVFPSNPTRTGDCQFLGWFIGKNGGTEVKSTDYMLETSGSVMVYAHWLVRIPFFDGKAGNYTFAANDFNSDWNCFFTTNKWAPVNDGQPAWITKTPTFNTSTKKVTVSCKAYTDPGNRYTLLYAYEKNTAHAILYKIGQVPHEYTITYVDEDGKQVLEPQTGLLYGTTVTLRENNLTKEGYVPNGWKASDGKILSHYVVIDDLRVLANYKPKTYTITYDLGYTPIKGKKTSTDTKIYGIQRQIVKPNQDRGGYKFLYWEDKATQKHYNVGDTYTDNKDVELVAVWKAYTVSFDVNAEHAYWVSGTEPKTKAWDWSGWDYRLPSAIPIKDKYSFVAWNTKQDGSGDFFSAGESIILWGQDNYIKSDMTLYAIWRKNQSIIKAKTFIGKNGSIGHDYYTYEYTEVLNPGESIKTEIEIPSQYWGYYKLDYNYSSICECWIEDQDGNNRFVDKTTLSYVPPIDHERVYYIHPDSVKNFLVIRNQSDKIIKVDVCLSADNYSTVLDENSENASVVFRSKYHPLGTEIWDIYLSPREVANYLTLADLQHTLKQNETIPKEFTRFLFEWFDTKFNDYLKGRVDELIFKGIMNLVKMKGVQIDESSSFLISSVRALLKQIMTAWDQEQHTEYSTEDYFLKRISEGYILDNNSKKVTPDADITVIQFDLYDEMVTKNNKTVTETKLSVKDNDNVDRTYLFSKEDQNKMIEIMKSVGQPSITVAYNVYKPELVTGVHYTVIAQDTLLTDKTYIHSWDGKTINIRPGVIGTYDYSSDTIQKAMKLLDHPFTENPSSQYLPADRDDVDYYTNNPR